MGADYKMEDGFTGTCSFQDTLEGTQPDSSIIFSLRQDSGELASALHLFKKRDVHLKHIESRPSKKTDDHYDFFVGIDESEVKPDNITKLLEDLKTQAKNVELHREEEISWFPRSIKDLDRIKTRILCAGSELACDHPGFTDPVYRERRKMFAEIALSYNYGEPLPRVEYTEKEIATWNEIFGELVKLFPTHACREVNEVLPLMMKHCNFRIGAIPQMADVSAFLKQRTGFTLRPVAGLITPRDFLSGLAFRVFHATQYIRHWKVPRYTPEPDVVHEMIGHVPLFADPGFAQFSQEIGLISLGAPDDWIEKLSTLYWFTVEFGLCRQNGEIKAYGGGLLSSFGELQYCLTDKPAHHSFVPEKIAVTPYPITEYQPQYFVSDSFEDAKRKLMEWASKIPKKFTVRYNPYTECVQTLQDTEEIMNLCRELRSNMDRIDEALKRHY